MRYRSPVPDDLTIREARDDDASGLIALIGGVFAEYPGCVLDIDGELPELRSIATWFARLGGRFWSVESQGAIVACVGCSPSGESRGLELRKLYVRRDARRVGLGTRLSGLVEREARFRDDRFVELWSDTRFLDAHRLYERLGYVRGAQTRALHDLSDTVEYYFRKDLAPARNA
jgi:putative acetyltransferase